MRRDGKKIKVDNVEYAITPHIMVERNDALNMVEVDLPLEPMQEYIRAKHKEGANISHLALIIAAYARTVGQFPMLNRFIVNSKVYARNEFNVAMVVLKAGETDNGTMSKVNFDPEDTIFEVNDKINKYIEINRNGENSTDALAKKLVSIPGLLRIGVSALKFLDKHGLLPRAIIDASPFHSSLTISNLASIRTNHIFHHIYNFGTTGVLITMGTSREVPKSRANGEIYFEKCMPLGIVMDERLCTGAYMALALRQFKRYLANPVSLEEKPDSASVIKEIPYRKDIK